MSARFPPFHATRIASISAALHLVVLGVVFGLALAHGLLLSGCTGEPADPFAPRGADEPPPSLVLVTLDTTRADRLGAYGSDAGLTPHLDALADQSVVFDMALAQSAVTPVSHASILTGLDPYHHGLRVLHGARHLLNDSVVTLPEILRRRGYSTAAFVSAFPAGSRFGLAQGFDVFDEDFLDGPQDVLIQPDGTVDTEGAQRRADATTDRALAWLESAAEPYFLWVHYFDPHDAEILPPDDFWSAAEPVGDDPVLAPQIAIYDHEVAFMDREIGRLLDALGEEAAIVVTADHGEGLGDHGWWGHGILYQEQIHVPLIVRLPGDATPRGRRVPSLVRTTDIVPTLLDLAGVGEEARPAMDGRSLRPWLASDELADDELTQGNETRWAYADSLNKRVFTRQPIDGAPRLNADYLFARIEWPWKYIHHLENPLASELYHLADDPDEAVDLFRRHPEIASRFAAELQRLQVLPSGPVDEVPMSDEELERLRALGYVE